MLSVSCSCTLLVFLVVPNMGTVLPCGFPLQVRFHCGWSCLLCSVRFRSQGAPLLRILPPLFQGGFVSWYSWCPLNLCLWPFHVSLRRRAGAVPARRCTCGTVALAPVSCPGRASCNSLFWRAWTCGRAGVCAICWVFRGPLAVRPRTGFAHSFLC